MLTDDVKIVIAVTTTNGAAGTSLVTSGAVDTQGFGGCCFVVPLGALVGGAVTSIKVQQSGDDAVADDYTDVQGTSVTIADTDDDKVKYIDVVRPGKRYLKLITSRATQNATLGGVIALLYDPGVRPVTQGTNVAGEQWSTGPIEGTA
jgi:hypothetical protein